MKMSPYLNPHLTLEAVLAEARAKRAQMIGDAVVNGVRGFATKIGAGIARLQAAHKQRAAVAQLMAMDERMLQDIGLNRTLVPFVVAGSVRNQAADLYADVGVGINVTANDNGLRHAA
jgi:uncharacterized protein YjiS (DUF1127 family)